jgi:hypothetical protein
MTFLKQWNLRLYHLVGWLPFTLGGALFLLLSLAAFWFLGVNRSDLILIIVGAVGVALAAIGFVVTVLSALVCFVRMRNYDFATTVILVVGEPERTTFNVPISWWVPLLQVHWSWENELFQAEIQNTEEVVTALRRGEWNSIVREIIIADAFGICSIRFTHEVDCELRVIPNVKKLQQPTMMQGLQAGSELSHPKGNRQGDRIDIRTYAPGDPVRYILWKVYARTGELVVRNPEKSYQPAKKMLVYLIVSEADEIAASLAMVVLQGDLLGTKWAFGVDGMQRPVFEKEAAMSVIVQSGNSTEQQAQGLSEFLLQNKEDESTLFVFAPATDGPWVSRILSMAHSVQIRLFICIDGLFDEDSWQQWKDILFLPEKDENPTYVQLPELQELLQKFHNTGVVLYIADQRSGVTISAQQFQMVAS